MKISETKIGIFGQGYVGLPLAVEFGKLYPTIGFDVNQVRVRDLVRGIDATNEATAEQIRNSHRLTFSDKLQDLSDCNVYIITVPTPLDEYKAPDLSFLKSASRMLGSILTRGDIVIYESTVYPGCTEEICIPLLENESGLKHNEDFFCGYSPERINPGDKINTLTKITKVVSGSNENVANFIAKLYETIIPAGIHLAPSIKVAEASKAVENAQRDLNISFVNELAVIFDRLDIDTSDVLEAASTKWNFLRYTPGLVGGHCISVDPYYLAHKAVSVGYNPEVILSGRRVNDSMGLFIASKLIKMLISARKNISNASVLIMGITFKENCPDIRNTKVVDVYNELKSYPLKLEIYDPLANRKEVLDEYGIALVESISEKSYDAILLAVSHREFLHLNFLDLIKDDDSVIYDIKSVLPKSIVTSRL